MAYTFNRNTPFLNSVFLGTDLSKSPEIATLLEVKGLRKDIERTAARSLTISQKPVRPPAYSSEATNVSLASELSGLTHSVTAVNTEVREGLNSVSHELRQGREDQARYNFELIAGLNNGFTGVIKSIHFGNQHLGQRLITGFAELKAQHCYGHELMRQGFAQNLAAINGNFAQTHAILRQTNTNLVRGMAQLDDSIQIGFAEQRQVMTQGFNGLSLQLGNQHRETLDHMDAGFDLVVRTLDRIGVMTARGLAALSQELQIMRAELREELQIIRAELREDIRHQNRYLADDDFLAGSRYLAGNRPEKARAEFFKAKDKFGGHFGALFGLAWIAILEGDLETADEWLQSADLQAGHNGDSGRERAMARFQLGRVRAAQGNFGAAADYHRQSYDLAGVASALVEEASCLIRALPNDDPAEMARVAGYIRQRFDKATDLLPNSWYLLALDMVNDYPQLALQSLQQGLHCDVENYNPERQEASKCDAILDVLCLLNAKNYQTLYEAMRRDTWFAFLFN